jgi:hypothetical protein
MFLLDSAYMHSTAKTQYSSNREALPLIKGIKRYEPGGGVQGTIAGNPNVLYQLWTSQLLYGLTDHLTLAVAMPLIVQSRIDANLAWKPGDYQNQLGRAYSEQDFWNWAKSMGQPRPPSTWIGNEWTPADMVVGLRFRLPRWQWMETSDVDIGLALQVALPTGKKPDPERLVVAGTTAWDLHAYADLQTHVAIEKFVRNEHGVSRFSIGADVFYGWMRTRTFASSSGALNPLLMRFSPYIGETYQIDGGDWLAGTLALSWAPIMGPTFATYITRGDMAAAHKLPPLLTLEVSHQYMKTQATDWISKSPLWDWDNREELWQAGDKNTSVASVTMSLLRVGAPLQLYVRYRTQELIPGRNTRAANVMMFGGRLLAKFW